MKKNTRSDMSAKQSQSREDRLKLALKANLARRKAQLRARDVDEDGKPVSGDKDIR